MRVVANFNSSLESQRVCLPMDFATYFCLTLLAVTGSVLSHPMENEMKKANEEPKRVLLILLDGFRWDYLNFPDLAGFKRIQDEGVRAEYMEALYPSESYPGYYSIATGLYAESHGMVLNYMFDDTHQVIFQMAPDNIAKQSFWWEQAEPLWITTTRRNISTAMMLWPGSDTKIHGLTAKYVVPYKSIGGTETFRMHLNNVLDMFVRNEIRYAQVYCEHTDMVGHQDGPKSETIKTAVKSLDNVMKELMDNITSKNLSESLHIVIVSDHGMAATDHNTAKRIDLNTVLQADDVVRVLDRGSHSGIYPAPGKDINVIVDKLNTMEGLKAYKKEDIPERLHFKNNSRTPPIYVIVEQGYFLLGLNTKQFPNDGASKIWNGFHGYDNERPDMNAIFLAWGSSFKKGFSSPPIKITDPYNLLTYLLDTEPLPNNGTWSKMEAMLTSGSLGLSSILTSFSLMIFTALVNMYIM